MGIKAFIIAGDRATAVANDVIDFRYCASLEVVVPGQPGAPHTDEQRETQIMVDRGAVEFMIGGATAIVLSGDFARVPRGMVYSYRNAGDGPAHLLVRKVSPAPIRRALHVIIDCAA